MRVCVYGAGAIGGHLTARLAAKTDLDTSVIARGAQLSALRDKGIRLRLPNGDELVGKPKIATDDPSTLPEQDLVLVTLKGPALPDIAASLARLLGKNGVALFLMNGLPWWWTFGSPNTAHLPLLDPDGALWRLVGPQRAVHCVISSSNQVVEPGLVINIGGNRWAIGEPNGEITPRVQKTVDLFKAMGLNGVATSDIRGEIWRKLCVNISSNPFAALTRLTSREGADIPDLDDIEIATIEETLAVAKAMGRDLSADINARDIVKPGGGRTPGRSSMLQDVDAGRALEVEGIMGQVQAFARNYGVTTPTIDVVLPLLRGLDKALRLAREARG